MLASVRTSLRRRAGFSLARSGASIAKRLGFALLRRGRRREAALCFACEHRIVRGYLDRFFARHGSQLSNTGEERAPSSPGPSRGWVLWWQGADLAPPLVTLCIESARRNLVGVDMVVLDRESAATQLELPAWLLERVRDRQMTLTSLSDVIRLKLLRRYGGAWLDATLLFLPGAELPRGADGFSTRRRSTSADDENTFVSRGRWSSFLLGGPAGLPLWVQMDTAFEIYWRAHDRAIDYHLLDYLLDYLYRHDLGEARRLIDSVPPSNPQMHELSAAMRGGGAGPDDVELDDETRIFKLTTRSPLDVDRIRDLVTGEGDTV